jgi:hypothetical protein
MLGEGVFQRRPGIAHGRAPNPLGTVQVPQSHIVKGVEHRGVHIVQSPYGNALGIRPQRALPSGGDKLVRHQHIAAPGVEIRQLADHRLQRVVVGVAAGGFGFGFILFSEKRARHSRLEKGQPVNGHGAVVILQHRCLRCSLKNAGDVQAVFPEQATAEMQALGGVVVAADHEHRAVFPGKPGEKGIQYGHRLGGGIGLVVDIPGDENGVGALIPNGAQNLLQNIFLIRNQALFSQPPAQMQVGRVKQFHGLFPFLVSG